MDELDLRYALKPSPDLTIVRIEALENQMKQLQKEVIPDLNSKHESLYAWSLKNQAQDDEQDKRLAAIDKKIADLDGKLNDF